jgi:hypothetical protein
LCWGSSFHGGLAHLLFYYPPFHSFTWWLSHCPRPRHFENASHPWTSLLVSMRWMLSWTSNICWSQGVGGEGSSSYA